MCLFDVSDFFACECKKYFMRLYYSIGKTKRDNEKADCFNDFKYKKQVTKFKECRILLYVSVFLMLL